MENIKIGVNVTITFTREFLADILCTAIEGGINYWAAIKDVQRNEELGVVSCSLKDAEDDEDEWHDVSTDTIIKGIELYLSNRDNFTKRLYQELLTGNAADYDVDDADLLVQLGLFGNIVYG